MGVKFSIFYYRVAHSRLLDDLSMKNQWTSLSEYAVLVLKCHPNPLRPSPARGNRQPSVPAPATVVVCRFRDCQCAHGREITRLHWRAGRRSSPFTHLSQLLAEMKRPHPPMMLENSPLATLICTQLHTNLRWSVACTWERLVEKTAMSSRSEPVKARVHER